jgi:hypothetical protein
MHIHRYRHLQITKSSLDFSITNPDNNRRGIGCMEGIGNVLRKKQEGCRNCQNRQKKRAYVWKTQKSKLQGDSGPSKNEE